MVFRRRRRFFPGPLTTLAMGAAAMYYLDPDRGKRRRALAFDRSSHLARCAQNDAAAGWRDLKNRVNGTAAEMKARLDKSEVSDEVLVERVRSKLGRCASSPHAIEASAQDGRITLRGDIPIWEAQRVYRAIRRVPGVRSVHNEMNQRSDVASVPNLQGSRQPLPNGSPGIFRKDLSPAARLVLGSVLGYGALKALPRISGSTLGLLAAGAALAAPKLAEGEPYSARRRAQRNSIGENSDGNSPEVRENGDAQAVPH